MKGELHGKKATWNKGEQHEIFINHSSLCATIALVSLYFQANELFYTDFSRIDNLFSGPFITFTRRKYPFIRQKTSH